MIADFLAAAELWPKIQEALPVIFSLVVIEGLLSVDNALAIAAMARHLDDKQRQTAMNIGYIGAYGFRVVALLVAFNAAVEAKVGEEVLALTGRFPIYN